MRFILIVSAILCATPSLAQMVQYHQPKVHYQQPRANDHIVAYGGYFDVTQDDNASAQFGLEYRFAPVWEGLRPTLGANFSTDSALYGYGGFYYDLHLSDSWVFSPNVVAGAFSQGDGKNLGHWIQFRSGLELNYRFAKDRLLGLAFNHISNASLGDANPGAETLLISYHTPLSW